MVIVAVVVAGCLLILGLAKSVKPEHKKGYTSEGADKAAVLNPVFIAVAMLGIAVSCLFMTGFIKFAN